jgi:hypothetical protein
MRDSKTLTDQALQTLQGSSNAMPTAAGQTGYKEREPVDKDGVINAINQMFAEFELVYHNQYQKAFPTQEKLAYGKKLWFSNLKDFSAEQILRATRRAIKESEFLPTVRGILKFIETEYDALGLPDARSAYMEACRAPSPKSDFAWSHPAVYYAGRESDWFFLANSIERQAFPVFERNYKIICERLLRGEQIDMPVQKALPAETHTPLSKQEQLDHLKRLREETGI